MAAGLVVPVSGAYLSTWNALPMGTQDDNGFELSCTIQGQEINASDAYGQTLVEGIYRGQNWRCRFRGLEWNKTGLLSILQMFGQTGANTTLTPALIAIGDRWTSYCQALLLTAILNISTPATLTATNAGFAPNSQSAFNLTSKMREFPLEMVLLPYTAVISSTTYKIPFSVT